MLLKGFMQCVWGGVGVDLLSVAQGPVHHLVCLVYHVPNFPQLPQWFKTLIFLLIPGFVLTPAYVGNLKFIALGLSLATYGEVASLHQQKARAWCKQKLFH